jgi:preprotein translocase subunit SecG
MRPFLIVLHVLVCFILILVVLLQAGRGANMGAVFGGASQTIFGSSGAGTFLSKMTTVVAIIFMLTTLSLSYFSSGKTASVVKDYAPSKAVEKTVPKQVPAPAPVAAPVAPTAPAPQAESTK